MPGALAEAAMGLDCARLVVGELTFHQAIAELARLDLERLHASRHLLARFVFEDGFEHCRSLLIRPTSHENDEVRLDGDRKRPRRSKGKHDSREIDTRRRPLHFAEPDVFDKDGRNDVHGLRP